MPTSLYIPFLLGGMILTGSSNSLWSKYQDMQCVENCSDPNPSNHVVFEQPVWQTLQMFIGEMLCFLPVLYTWFKSRRHSVHNQTDSGPDLHNKFDSPRPLQGWKILLLWIPAACDLTGTTLMNVGLLYTPVSIFQMTRGALVLFVGIFSVVFLRRHLWLYQWVSLIFVIAGVALVGYSGSLIKDALESVTVLLARALGNHNDDSLVHSSAEEPELGKVIVGVFLILFAQVFAATQFVVEEKILARYSVSPLVAVGYEGLFGTISILLFVPILSIPSISALSPFFDLPRGWYQMINSPAIINSSLAICLSISFFNFFGLSVTRHASATVRAVTDTCRTLCIWIISLGLGWEKLLFPISLLQVLGFSLVVYGTFLFNSLVKPPSCLAVPHDDTPVMHLEDEEEREVLLTGTLEETATLPVDLGQSGFDVLPEGEHVIADKGDAKTPTPYHD